MPGSVALASPVGVLPFSLCKAYNVSLEWQSASNTYASGEYQAAPQTDAARRTWKLTERLTPANLLIQRTHFKAHRGPFYFYDIGAGAVYDATGSRATGRYIVRYDGGLTETGDVARSDVSFVLIQIA